jgi:hypothetical protein
MRITLDLPQALANELSAEAARLGLPLGEYALRVLSTGRAGGHMPKTGPELVAYWHREGVIGTRCDLGDSQAHARAIRHKAERRVPG